MWETARVAGIILPDARVPLRYRRNSVTLEAACRCTAPKEDAMAKYGKKAQDKVHKVMRERKEGKLRSGGSHRKVTSRKQAIAIGLSEARREGDEVPPNPNRKSGGRKTAKKSGARKSSGKSAAKKSSSARKSTKKSPARKSTRKSPARKSTKKSSARKSTRKSTKKSSAGKSSRKRSSAKK
jgi:hypothetical protein